MNNEYLDPDSLPSPLNIRDCSTIQLSSAYKICPSSSPIKNIILEITKQIIDSIQSMELSDRDLCELVPLFLMRESALSNKLFTTLIDKIRNDSLPDIRKMECLSQMIFYGGQDIDPNEMLQSLRVIAQKMNLIVIQNETLTRQCLDSLCDILDAITTFDITVQMESINEVLIAMDQLKSRSSKTGTLKVEIEYAKQALLNITKQKTDYEKLLLSTYSIVKGVLKISFAIAKQDPKDLIEGIIETYQEGKKIHDRVIERRRVDWFTHVRTMKFLARESFENFRDYFHHLSEAFPTIESGKSEILLSAISIYCNAINDIVQSSEMILDQDPRDGSPLLKPIREVALRDLGMVYLNVDYYGKELEIRTVIVDSLWNYCSLSEESSRTVAKDILFSVFKFIELDEKTSITQAPPKSLTMKPPFHLIRSFQQLRGCQPAHPIRVWLNETGIQSKLPDPELRGSAVMIADTSQTLVARALEQTDPVLYHLEGMRKRSFHLCNSSLKKDLDIYIPMDCRLSASENQVFSLMKMMEDFLSQSTRQKLLLLHGLAGSGKSLFARSLEFLLWKEFVQGDQQTIIPIFISLAALKDPTRRAIQETLTEEGFSQTQIEKLRNQRVLFIFDGFDEIQCKQNLYDGNKLEEWTNAKVIITARSEYLFAITHYLSLFGNRDDMREYFIKPFDEDQRRLFFDKFSTQRSDCNWNGDMYESHLNGLQGLNELTNTPFMLRIVAEILPSIIETTTKTRLTRSLIFEFFTEHEFLKCRDKLRMLSNKENGITIPHDFDEVQSFRKFSMQLAVLMYVAQLNSITVKGSDFRFLDEQTDQWDPFFSNTDDVAIASRYGAPLSSVARQRFFRHKSLQEFFAAKMLLRELDLYSTNQICTEGYLNQRSLMEEYSVREFLVEMLSGSPFYENILWKIIIASTSTTGSLFSVACGNALTLLVLLNFTFVDVDLSHVNCRGAILSSGKFIRVNFQNGSFSECLWDGAYFESCVFNGSNISDAFIRERSSIPYPLTKDHSMINLSGEDIIVASNSDDTSIWSSGQLVRRYDHLSRSILLSSRDQQWIFAASMDTRQGVLFQARNFDNSLTIQYLVCRPNAISLTNDQLLCGTMSDSNSAGVLRLMFLSLKSEGPLQPSYYILSKVKSLIAIIPLPSSKTRHLWFLYFTDDSGWGTCSVIELCPAPTASTEGTYLTLISKRISDLQQFMGIPGSNFILTWSANKNPFILMATPELLSHVDTIAPLPARALDCCISPDGSHLLLESEITGGGLYSIEHQKIDPQIIKFDLLLQVSTMTGPLSSHQFSSNGEYIVIATRNEAQVFRLRGCLCLQIIQWPCQIEGVIFGPRDQELLLLDTTANSIIRRKVELKETPEPEHIDSSSELHDWMYFHWCQWPQRRRCCFVSRAWSSI
jgi:hypothetical protein